MYGYSPTNFQQPMMQVPMVIVCKDLEPRLEKPKQRKYIQR